MERSIGKTTHLGSLSWCFFWFFFWFFFVSPGAPPRSRGEPPPSPGGRPRSPDATPRAPGKARSRGSRPRSPGGILRPPGEPRPCTPGRKAHDPVVLTVRLVLDHAQDVSGPYEQQGQTTSGHEVLTRYPGLACPTPSEGQSQQVQSALHSTQFLGKRFGSERRLHTACVRVTSKFGL
jgi:hypothetical protein